jgi:hypothetical protein
MKKKITLLGIATLSFGAILFNTNTNLIANAGGSVGGYSSSTGDNGNSCGQGGCHGGGHIVDPSGYVSSDIPVTGYVPGSTYTIQVGGGDRGKSKFGFELAAENNSGVTSGTLAPSVSGREQLKSNGQITHTSSGNTGAASNFGWQASWQAPSIGSGDVVFSVAVLFTNSSGGNTGDSTRISSLTISEDVTVSVNELNSEIKSLYPNPVVNDLNIELKSAGESIISIVNSNGKIVKKSQAFNALTRLDLSDLTNGVYVVSIMKDGKTFTQAIVKQ